MTVLELRFPAGRYHATPWGRHVNEGAVEWPPSPWRILRALIATWHLKARVEIPEATIRALADALSLPPKFRLPSATTAHTRHFMPTKGGDKTKIFDTFIQIAEKESILVAWSVDLPSEQLAALQTLANRLGYLGRAESLVEARILKGVTAIEPNAISLAEGAKLPEKTELIRLLAPMNPVSYSQWRIELSEANKPTANGKKTKAGVAASVPEDLFAALHADTGDLQVAGWNLPPGAEFVNYASPENAFASAIKPRPRHSKELPTVARYALASTVPPGMVRALAVGEQIHAVLCKESNGHSIFTGAGQDGHQHAHIFSESVKNNLGHITHVTVFAPKGFDDDAVKALRGILWTWGFKQHELRLILQGIGQPSDFVDCEFFHSTKKWRSFTPFVTTRHAKIFNDGRPKMDANGWQIGSPGHDLLRLLSLHREGTGAHIRQLDERACPYRFSKRRLRSLQFQTIRHGGDGSRGDHNGAAFEIAFPTPRPGPFAFGYGAHFGLGLFVPSAVQSK